MTTDGFLNELAQSAYGWPGSLRFTYDKTRELLAAGIHGDLVECGVGNGVHPAVMARACIEAGDTRTVRLFDSFQGVPHGGPNDHAWNEHYGDGSGTLETTGVAACSEEDVRNNLYRWLGADKPLWLGNSQLVFHAGWFQETLPAAAEFIVDGMAFLRIDCDLYESTLTCLRYLYPLVTSGGVVVIDDWNLDGCRAATRAYFNDMGAGYGAGPLRGVPNWQPITASGDVWFAKP